MFYLEHIVQAAKDIKNFMRNIDENNFKTNDLVQSAVVRKIEIIGEASKKVSAEMKKNHPDIKWRDAAGMRDVLIHAYFKIDIGSVWKTASADIPEYTKNIRKIIKDNK